MYLYIIYLSFKKEGKCFTEAKKREIFSFWWTYIWTGERFDLSPVLWEPSLKNFNQIKVLESLHDKYEAAQ